MGNESKAVIIAATERGREICASAARISTAQGSALEVLERGRGPQKDLSLIQKVLASGHKTVLEHHVFTVAFNNVSVLVEQFMIEFRLASFTVQSRRYVDFQGVGFRVPEGVPDGEGFRRHAQSLFEDYARLTALGVPKEDARFVLPYCFYSNFYCTCDAREWMHIIEAMRYGRGRAFAELRALGEQLEEQFEAYYPGALSAERRAEERVAPWAPRALSRPHAERAEVELVSAPADCLDALRRATAFSGRFGAGEWRALASDARPRELECLSFTFHIRNVSLACATHFARHRMQSPLFERALTALERGGYVLPDSVAGNEAAASVYRAAFERNHAFAARLLEAGADGTVLSYLALSGNVFDILMTANARELLHFFKLRTCNRAQWEIRAVAFEMLSHLRARCPELFCWFGPSCALGPCPEGRLSCGKPHSAG